MERLGLSITIPRLKDPRLLFILFAATFLIYIFNLPGFGHSIYDYFYFASWCMFFEVLFRKLIQDKWVLPVSGLIPSFGMFIVCDVIDKIYYIPLAFAAIGSKVFIQRNGTHIFNPGNFGIVVVCLALKDQVSLAGFLRWDGDLLHSLYIFICGMILAWRVNRWAVTLSYIFSSVIISPIVGFLKQVNPLSYFHNLMWQGTVIFLFFMLTDPKTSPNKLKYQVIFGIFTAFVAQVLRYNEIRLSEHRALLLACLVYALFESKTNDKYSMNYWENKEVAIVSN